MPTFAGKSVPFNRLLGQVDQDDPTNLPVGCASVCRNTDFTRDSPGITSAGTRAGNCMTMQGAASPGTGLWDYQHAPTTETDPFFQMVIRFTLSGVLEYESPTGSGHMKTVPAGMFALPANCHKLDTQAGNRVWSAYTQDLQTPASGLSCFNPKTLDLDPMGMKPFGFNWVPNTLVYKGEVVTPSLSSAGPQGNGHTYQAQSDGTTGAVEPTWPLTESGTVVDGTVTWKELTMVIANRLPEPPAPALSLVNSVGFFPSGQTVYILLTFVNGAGETVAGTIAAITTTALNQAVNVTIPALAALPGWLSQLAAPYAITGVNIYEMDVVSGNPQPAISTFEQSGGPFALGSTQQVIGTAASAVFVPTINSARITPGQLPTPTTEPVIERNSGAGTFPAGRDVYIAMAYANANGQTPIGPANSVVNTLLNDAVKVTLSQPAQFPQLTQILLYEADVPTGADAPPKTAFSLVGTFSPTATATITTTATGPNPVTVNGTGPGGNVSPDSETGGINNTQGYTYAVPQWINRNETFSGFTQAAVVKYIVDEAGWEISVFNVATGPKNIIGRAVNFTTANSTQEGGFWWIGRVNLIVPTQNQVYPNSFLSNGISVTPTVFLDNVTTTGTFNFYDDFLKGANNTTDRLRIANVPPKGVRVDYIDVWDRTVVAGPPGNKSGCEVSLGASEYESFYGDTSPIPIRSLKAEQYWGTVVFRNEVYGMREQSAVVMTQGTGDPSSWNVTTRWGPTADAEGVGPCGPRAFAACAQFIIFVHRSGVYRYDGTAAPNLMTKEIPRMWNWINWRAAQQIAVTIDNDTHTVRIQVPLGNSQINNMEFCLSYLEGWLNPIHFSSYGQREIAQEACRRWAFNDVSAYVCRRIQRRMPNFTQQAGLESTATMFGHGGGGGGGGGPLGAPIWILRKVKEWINRIPDFTLPVPAGLTITPGGNLAILGRPVTISVKAFAAPALASFGASALGPDGTTQLGTDFSISQLVYTSTAPDGLVNARTPGRYDDNGTGIDWKYQSVSAQEMQKPSKAEGVVVSCIGNGAINVSFIAGRRSITSSFKPRRILRMVPIQLAPDSGIDFTRKPTRATEEYWSVAFDNGKVPGVWANVKKYQVYILPVKVARGIIEGNK